jgi:hypothetical protein
MMWKVIVQKINAAHLQFGFYFLPAADFRKFFSEIEIGGNTTGNQSGATAECQILNCPLRKDQNPALKSH